jgi:hypothetical protein
MELILFQLPNLANWFRGRFQSKTGSKTVCRTLVQRKTRFLDFFASESLASRQRGPRLCDPRPNAANATSARRAVPALGRPNRLSRLRCRPVATITCRTRPALLHVHRPQRRTIHVLLGKHCGRCGRATRRRECSHTLSLIGTMCRRALKLRLRPWAAGCDGPTSTVPTMSILAMSL